MFDALVIFTVINCTYAYCVDVEVGDDDRVPFELRGISGQKLERALKAWRYGVLSKMQSIGNQGEKKEDSGKKWIPRRTSRPHSPLRPRAVSITSDPRIKNEDHVVVAAVVGESGVTEGEKQLPLEAAVRGDEVEAGRTATVASNSGNKRAATAARLKTASGGGLKESRQQAKTAARRAANPVAGASSKEQRSKLVSKQGKQQVQKLQPLARSASLPCSRGMEMVHGSRSPELLATAAQAAKVAAIVKGGRGKAVSEEERARGEARRERAAAALRESHKWERERWESGAGCGRLSILRKTKSM